MTVETIERIACRNPNPPMEELVLTQEESLAQEQSKGFAKTIQFIEKTLAEEAHFNVPKSLAKGPRQWERNLDATLTYLLSPDDISLEHVGHIYGYTREWVRQTRDKTMKELWLNSSPETQSLFPFEELELNKPRPQKTKETIVFPRDQPESKSSHQKNQELLRNLKSASTDKERQRILDQITHPFYLENTKGDDPLLRPVKKAIVKAGYHVRRPQDPSLFYEVIKTEGTEGIPMANIQRKTKVGSNKIVLTYHAILTEDEGRAENAWRKREDLQKFLISPVQQVAGPEQQGIPSAFLIRQRNRFRKLGALLLEFGVPLGKPTEKYRTVLLAIPDCPVPIYRYSKSYLYPVAREGELISHMKQFLETLRTNIG